MFDPSFGLWDMVFGIVLILGIGVLMIKYWVLK